MSKLKSINPTNNTASLSQEKGASTWLSVIPLEEYGFASIRVSFRDAACACGTHFAAEHVQTVGIQQ